MTQTADQKARATTLLLGSESPSAFFCSVLVKKKDLELGVVDLYEHYQAWSRENNVRPFASRPFTLEAKAEIEIGLGLKYRHDLEGLNGKAMRGWKGLAFIKIGRVESGQQESTKLTPTMIPTTPTTFKPSKSKH